jgi:uncharacterized protein (DUF58 family)
MASDRATARSETLLQPEVLSALGRLDLVARTVVEGFLTGLHRSPFHGPSQDFAKHRPYQAGDEVRRVDWRVFARTDRLYIKEFDDETSAPVRILLDTSGSLRYQPAGISKFRYAQFLAASLAYLAIRQNDRVGLVCFGQQVTVRLPARGSQRHLHALLGALEKVLPGGATSIGATLVREAEQWRRRGVVLLISDLYDEPSEVIDAATRVRRAGHDLIVFHLLAGEEKDLAVSGMVEFRDLETGATVIADAAAIRRDYRERLAAANKLYRDRLQGSGVTYVEMNTSEPLDRELATFLHFRRSRGR